MGKVIAVASQKGGTAKSTTCRNVATILKYMGYKVLVVDCDNQANLTDCFGIESPDKLDVTLYHLMENIIMDEDLPEKEAYIINREGVDVLPASTLLSDIEIKLVNKMTEELHQVTLTMTETKTIIRDYNGLRDKFNDTDDRIQTLEDAHKFKQLHRQYIGWVIGSVGGAFGMIGTGLAIYMQIKKKKKWRYT